MIIVKLQGGLGNQMFQYAAGLALAKKHGVELKLDLATYDHDDIFKRTFLLDKFKIDAKIATSEEVDHFKKQGILFKIKDKLNPAHRKKIVIEKPFIFFGDFDKIECEAYLDGYWQSEKYFKRFADDIKKSFELKDVSPCLTSIINEVSRVNSVSIHVRRADYVTLDFVNDRYGVCPASYYKMAAEEITNKIGPVDYYIFSDDVAWIKANLELGGPATIISEMGLKDYEEVIVMSKCRHNIIANSSFSWWGAWLNQNPDKIVCAPKKWLKTSVFDPSYILPSEWIKL